MAFGGIRCHDFWAQRFLLNPRPATIGLHRKGIESQNDGRIEQELNKLRPNDDKILVFPLDVKFDWKEYTAPEQLRPLFDYSRTAFIDHNYGMGKNFVMLYEAAKKKYPNGKKALVIQNIYHGNDRQADRKMVNDQTMT